MAQRRKMPRDANQLAKAVVDMATAETPVTVHFGTLNKPVYRSQQVEKAGKEVANEVRLTFIES